MLYWKQSLYGSSDFSKFNRTAAHEQLVWAGSSCLLRQSCLVCWSKFLSLGYQAELLQGWQSSGRFEFGSCPKAWMKSLVSQSSLQHTEVFLSWACILSLCLHWEPFFLLPVKWGTQLNDGEHPSWKEPAPEWCCRRNTWKKEINIMFLIYDLKSFWAQAGAPVLISCKLCCPTPGLPPSPSFPFHLVQRGLLSHFPKKCQQLPRMSFR